MLGRFRSIANPFTRAAILAFVWSHRRTIMRWGRSFWNELRRPEPIDRHRLSLLTAARSPTAGGPLSPVSNLPSA